MEYVVISLGGSIVVPEEIDVRFLKKFRRLILSQARKGRRFVIIVGGGKTCRKYQGAAKEMANPTQEELDWIGIHSTRLNAQLMHTALRGAAHPLVLRNYNEKVRPNKPVIIACGWKPGWSTDYDAVMWARNFKSHTIINLSDVDYIYDRDPDFHRDARIIRTFAWKDFRKLVGNKWRPGLNVPFDPVASREAQKLSLKIAIMNGRNLRNLESFLDGKPFRGTVIEG
jgi:uridylate kinase